VVETEDKMTPMALDHGYRKHQTAMVHGAQRGPGVDHQGQNARSVFHSLERVGTPLTAVAKRYDLPVHLDGGAGLPCMVALAATPGRDGLESGRHVRQALAHQERLHGCRGSDLL